MEKIDYSKIEPEKLPACLRARVWTGVPYTNTYRDNMNDIANIAIIEDKVRPPLLKVKKPNRK